MSDLIEKLEAWARTPRVKMSGVQHKDAAEMLDLLSPVLEAVEACRGSWTTPELRLVDEALADLCAKLEAK